MKHPPTAGPGHPTHASLRRFAWFVLALNLAVIVWGGFVRASGSGAGCGAHWPLCNGVVVPQDPKIETLIELGHRLTSGLALVAVVALGVWMLRRSSKATAEGRGMRRLAWLAMAFIFGEAALGAGIVLLEYVGQNSSSARAVWMAAHLINTFLL
ncbi:MAG: COX15/CtaA family protein, partial [Thermoanaerobaculia bacterium]